jgi:effector-binding domain-containing protein
MRYLKTISFPVILFVWICMSCSPEAAPEKKKEEPAAEKKPIAEKKITDTTSFSNNIAGYSNEAGPLGVLDVPEMLVLSRIDSAEEKNVSSAVVKDYALLEEEMNAIGAEMNGPIGLITYNNNPKNFLFEAVLCIKHMPSVQPKRCKIVVLEASNMLIYNFYGSYQNLFVAYSKIKTYCEKKNLSQSGPMREFYITDPEKEKDPQKWLTRIMLPVVSAHKK